MFPGGKRLIPAGPSMLSPASTPPSCRPTPSSCSTPPTCPSSCRHALAVAWRVPEPPQPAVACPMAGWPPCRSTRLGFTPAHTAPAPTTHTRLPSHTHPSSPPAVCPGVQPVLHLPAALPPLRSQHPGAAAGALAGGARAGGGPLGWGGAAGATALRRAAFNPQFNHLRLTAASHLQLACPPTHLVLVHFPDLSPPLPCLFPCPGRRVQRADEPGGRPGLLHLAPRVPGRRRRQPRAHPLLRGLHARQ